MKLPFTFGINLVLRLLLPGFFLSLGFLPIIYNTFDLFGWTIKFEYAFPLVVFFMGWLTVSLDLPIYMLFEGRRFWPDFLRNLCINLEKRRLKKINKKIRKFKETQRQKYLEASVELRKFPMNDEGEYEALFPTRLGNLLLAYEAYPERIYGMDVVFYWYRIWLKLDKDLREEIDSQQAMADSAVYTSFALFVSGSLCFIYTFFSTFEDWFIKYIPDDSNLWLLSFVFLLTGYGIYRISIHLHAQFGETFKSVFDVYEKEIEVSEIVDEVSSLINDQTKSPIANGHSKTVLIGHIQINYTG